MEAGLLAGFPTDFISEAFMIKPTMPACLDPIYNIRISMDCYTGCAVCDISLEGIGELKKYQKNLRSYLGNDKANEAEHRSFPLRITKLSTRNCWKYHLGGRKMSLGGRPPMSRLPLERTTDILFGSVCIEEYNDEAKSFDVKMQELGEKLNTELVIFQLVLSNPYDILSEIIRNPVFFVEFCCHAFTIISIVMSLTDSECKFDTNREAIQIS
ncbi:hypothetical protein ACFX1Q_030403 [Malus domestica]